MLIFDYIYFRIYKFYEGFNENGAWAFGIPAMAMSQYFIITSLDRIFNPDSFFLKGNIDYLAIFLLVIFNFTRYYWFVPYRKLERKWRSENKRQMAIGSGLVLLYLFGSLFCGLYFTGFFNRLDV
jgi:hypothetical protein